MSPFKARSPTIGPRLGNSFQTITRECYATAGTVYRIYLVDGPAGMRYARPRPDHPRNAMANVIGRVEESRGVS